MKIKTRFLPTRTFSAVLLASWLASVPAALAAPGDKSPDGLWTEIAPESLPVPPPYAFVRTNTFRTYELNEAALEALLQQAPVEQPGNVLTSPVILTIPLPTGTFARFRVVQSSILSPALSAQHPELRTYLAQGIDEPTVTVRFDRTPAGFHAMVLSREGTVYVDPYSPGDTQHYLNFFKSDLVRDPNDFKCNMPGDVIIGVAAANPARRRSARTTFTLASGATLRIYRLAVTATGEYTTVFGSVAAAQAQIVTSINRVTGIYEQEVAIRFNIVAFNIYADPTTDPFTSGGTVDGLLLGQNQTDLDANVGSANYDIGHIVSQGTGGGFAPGDTCVAATKAQGGTSRNTPSGDPFDVDYLAHEIGHQLSGSHTFNGTTMFCGTGRTASSAFEPGSGTTIMGYAGICGSENVQANSDAFFHKRSFDQIVAFRDGAGACGTTMATGNNPPTVNAGPNFTIPTGTPFTLTATGSDPDGDALTFAWDQFDLGSASPPPNNADGPLFRSRPPTTSPARTFPRLADILSGAPTPWEILPTVNRTLNFCVVARDHRAGGGGVGFDCVTITVSGLPFRVASPNGGESFQAGCSVPVTWTVGGGNVASAVDILFSGDGGNTFTALATSVPNSGSANVILPCANTTAARIMVRAVGNIFFDVSDADFAVAPVAPIVTCNVVGGPVDNNCRRLVTFTATVTDDCCITPAGVNVSVSLPTGNATLGTPTLSITQVTPTTVTVQGSVLVSALTGSPATVQVQVNTADCCGATASCISTANVTDPIPPQITCDIIGGPVDDRCERLVTFSALVKDNCCVNAASVTAQVALLTANATLGVPSVTVVQAGPGIVTVTGSVLVSGLLGGPATLQLLVQGSDCAGNAASCSRNADVVDVTPPTVTCTVAQNSLWPPNHGMINVGLSASAIDNCSGVLPVTVRVLADEDDEEATGDGKFSPDASGIAPATLRLRSERKGNADGRVYLIITTATDTSGNTGIKCCTVTVPHSNGRKAISKLNSQAQAAEAYCHSHNGTAPPGFVPVGDGPAIGPKP